MKKVLQYVEEFCPVWHYRCLMPVEYEEIESGGDWYQKTACVCTKTQDGTCTDGTVCSHFKNAEDKLDITKTVIP